MKRRMRRVLTVLTVLVLLTACALPAYAAVQYEPLTVTVSLQDVFTTNDESADGEFNFLITADEPADAPLPAEADSSGAFTVDTKTATPTASGDNKVYTKDQVLTFTFDAVGDYFYTLKEDVTKDEGRENADRYTFDESEYKLKFYVVYGSQEGTLALKATIIIGPDQEKVEDIVFEQTYEKPTTPPPPPTGDKFKLVLYIVLGAVSVCGIVALLVTRRKKEENHEENA